MCFSWTDDEDFSRRTDEGHHVDSCPHDPLPIGFVSKFGLDYMHFVCLGVMRRSLLYWKGPVGPLHVRLGRKAVGEISTRLMFLAAYIPIEFARKPRSLDDLNRWKATEFCEFLLYSGVSALRTLLPNRLYMNISYCLLALEFCFRILSQLCWQAFDKVCEGCRNSVWHKIIGLQCA